MKLITGLKIMDLSKFAHDLTHTFGGNHKDHVHTEGVLSLMEKLKAKEQEIRLQFDSEKDEVKRNKHKLSLLVLQAQKNKAQKLLNT